MDDILVSINCITYNHEDYIKTTIEGCLEQKTNFKFELVIGDDCSTDNTKAIIEEYVAKYPDIIKLVTSEKNVGARENEERVLRASKGKFIAICEGDDYWADENKLQKQIDYMLENKDCTLCFHNAHKFDDVTKQFDGIMLDKNIESHRVDVNSYLDLEFIPTSSTVYRRDAKENYPKWYFSAIVGDLPRHLIAIDRGYGYYMKDVMGVYRTNNINSIMGQWAVNRDTIEKKAKLYIGYKKIFEDFNKDTDYKYDKAMKHEMLKQDFYSNKALGNLKELKKPKYKELFKSISTKEKIVMEMINKTPWLYERLLKVKINKINKQNNK